MVTYRAFAGEYGGTILQGLLSKVGLVVGRTVRFSLCLDTQHGYPRTLSGYAGQYSVRLDSIGEVTGGAQASDVTPPVSFVADWATCNGNSIEFYYVPINVSGPILSISALNSPTVSAHGYPDLVSALLNRSGFAPYSMHRLNFTTAASVHSGEDLDVCSGSDCYVMQCQ